MLAPILLLSAVVVFFVGLGVLTRPSKGISLSIDAQPAAIAKPRNLTSVAQEVYAEYMRLPPESRPFDNIVDILRSLDAVTIEPNTNSRDHFDSNRRPREKARDLYYGDLSGAYPFKFSWDISNCDHKACKYSAYYALHVEIDKVKKALDAKARALVESENAHNVAMAAELADALRQEAGILTKVTDEIRSKA